MRRVAGLVAPLVVGIVAVVAATSAMLPGLAFWDTGEFQAVAPLLGTAHPTGYPTYVVLGWLANLVLAPFGEPAFRMNLFAGLSVGVAAAVTTDLARTLTRSTPLGMLAGLGLALTPAVWSIGTRADAHALHLALLAILLRLLVGWEDARTRAADDDPANGRRADRWLVAATVVFGLSVGNHSLTLLLAVPVGLYVLAVEPGILRRPRFVLTCVAVLVGTVVVVFLELPLRAGPFRADLVYGRPETWDGFWYIVLAQQFQGSFIDPIGDLAGKTAGLVSRAVGQFGILAVLIPAGLVTAVLVRPRYALLTGTAMAITLFFAASYVNADIGRYYLGPILIAWTWVAILVRALIDAVLGPAAIDPLEPGTDGPRSWSRPATVLGVVALAVLLVPTALALPDRHARVDARAETDARQWVDEALAAMDPDAVVVSWWSYSTPLWYAQRVEGRRPDIRIVDDRTRLDEDLGDYDDVIDANLPSRPVYVIRDDPAEIEALSERYRLAPVLGPNARFLVRVLGPREAAS